MDTFKRPLLLVLLALLTVGYGAQSVVRDVPYVAAFAPINSVAQPFSGTMRLNFNHGIVSGYYNDTSGAPGAPLANRLRVPVSGGVSSDGSINLVIGPLSFHGKLHGRWMSGTAFIHGRIYTFKAKQGVPGQGH